MSNRSPPSSATATSVARSSTPSSARTGSAAFASASSGKYIRVARRFSRPRAKTPTTRCGAWSRPSGMGTRPGLTVVNSNQPSSTVPQRPKPAEPVLERHVVPVVGGVRVPPRRVRLPDLDHAVGHGIAVPVHELPPDPDRPRIVVRDERRPHLLVEEADGEVRPDRLRRRQPERLSHRAAPRAASPPGRRRRCRSGSREPTSGSVRSSSKSQIRRSRACSSGIELKIGSNGKSGSPGKYICVTSRSGKARPKTEMWMCAGPPGVRVVLPRVRARLDRHEAVACRRRP